MVYYRSVPSKHPLLGKYPCTAFQGARNAAASTCIQFMSQVKAPMGIIYPGQYGMHDLKRMQNTLHTNNLLEEWFLSEPLPIRLCVGSFALQM